ncbi:MAG: pyruvate dehydrogenase complex dihydrolipoamide acetyltransferase [Chloroflexota bacterium]
MATEVTMPRLSDTMDSGTIARWHKSEGDAVKRGDVIAEIETDKANMDLESYADGILARIVVAEGGSVALGQPIAIIAADENEAQSLRAGNADDAAVTVTQEAAVPTGGEAQSQAAYGEDGSNEVEQVSVGKPSEPLRAAGDIDNAAPQVAASSSGHNGRPGGDANGRIKASPLARRLAQENRVELVKVSGTGPGGRITKDDVLAFLKQSTAAPAKQEAPPPAPAPAARPAETQGIRSSKPVEMTRMQQTIARRMAAAKSTAPEFVLTTEFDMTEARALVGRLTATEGAPRVGVNDLLIKAVAGALHQHPEVNSGWENDTMVRYGRINVGFAVAIEDGLVVPVIPDTDQKSLGAIAREAKSLIEKARAGKLAPQEYEGGTFSVSNLGMYGIEQFIPIINIPEACILGVGAIEQKPVVIDGDVVVRDRMHVTLSCDHRVVNGAQGAEYLKTLRRLLEHPMLVLL